MARTPEMQSAIDAVEARPCQCVTCPECRGTGNVFFSFGGRHYLGSSRWDDLDEMETCDNCRGGIIQKCDRCGELDELYEQEEYETKPPLPSPR
jgi:hypothetical protein